MTWFDAVVLALAAAVLIFEVRQEAGRSLLDAVAALAALNFASHLSPWLTLSLHWKPLPGTEVAPLAFGICFGGLLLVGLVISTLVHRRTRWSMDHYNVAFSTIFGLVVAATIGHAVTDVAARQALLQTGRLPDYIQGSLVAEELRSFRTYQYVVNTFEEYHYHRD